MEYICPYCGSREQSGLYCRNCLRKIDWAKEIQYKSAWYYNRGYEAALTRNLTQASKYLKEALLFNKHHIEARNLLGLIYFETGQVGLALKEWIISQSLCREENRAAYYIEQIQENSKILSEYKEAVMLYNKALDYLKQKNMDMAIIRLKKAISKNPKFVEARILIGLSYMHEEQFHKANEQIKKALLIDRGHEKGLFYYKEMSEEDTQSVKPYEVEYEGQMMKLMQPSKVIDRTRLFRRYLLYFLLGAIGMFLVDHYLILSSQIRGYQLESARLSESEERLTQNIQSLTREHRVQIAELEKSKSKLESQVASYEKQVGEWMQKEKITQAKELIKQRNYVEAAQVLYSVATAQLDETFINELEELKQEAYPKATETLYNEGMQFYNKEQLVEANMKFETVLLYDPNERLARKSLYAIGCIYEQSGSLENAKQYFNKVIEKASDTSEAREAQRKLEKIETNS